MHLNVGPTSAPGASCSESAPANRSISSGCLQNGSEWQFAFYIMNVGEKVMYVFFRPLHLI